MASSVFRFADFTIGADRSEGASAPIRVVECTTCADASEPAGAGEQWLTDKWAIAHAGQTQHTGFREIVTAFLRVTPTPDALGEEGP